MFPDILTDLVFYEWYRFRCVLHFQNKVLIKKRIYRFWFPLPQLKSIFLLIHCDDRKKKLCNCVKQTNEIELNFPQFAWRIFYEKWNIFINISKNYTHIQYALKIVKVLCFVSKVLQDGSSVRFLERLVQISAIYDRLCAFYIDKNKDNSVPIKLQNKITLGLRWCFWMICTFHYPFIFCMCSIFIRIN